MIQTERLRERGRSIHRSVFAVTSGLLALALYLGVAWFVFPVDAFCTPDEGAKLLQLQNLRLENGHLAYGIGYSGRDLDPDLRFAQSDPVWGFLRVRGNELFFGRLPVFPLLVLPFFRGFGFPGLYVLPALAGSAVGVLALQLLRRRDRRLAMWMLIAFGSPVLIYATLFWEHTLATAMGLAGAWLAFRMAHRTPRARIRAGVAWTLVGLALGLSIYIRLESALFVLGLLLAYWLVVKENRWGAAWAAGVVAVMLIFYFLLHRAMFGQAYPDNARFLFYPFYYLRQAGWRAVPDLLVGPPVEGAIDSGWLGGLWAIAAVVAVVHSFGAEDARATRAVRLLGLAITAVVAAVFLFAGDYYYAAHGLLFSTPWVLLGLSRTREVWHKGGWRAQIIVLTTILGLIGYSVAMTVFRASSPQGGLEWGARFALTFFPLLALIAAWDLGARRKDVATLAIAGALVFLGLGFQVRGILAFRQSKLINARFNQLITEFPEQNVVFEQWWMPLNSAPVYTQKAVFVASSSPELSEWVELAAAHRIKGFSLVTDGDVLLDDTAETLDGRKLRVTETRGIGSLLVYRVQIGAK